jgi:hypothetical protein
MRRDFFLLASGAFTGYQSHLELARQEPQKFVTIQPELGEEIVNADLSFKPDPPKADENLEIELEWPEFAGDSIDIIVEFFPAGTASTITVTVTRPGKATIAIPKGVTSVNARDKNHQANPVTAKVSP